MKAAILTGYDKNGRDLEVRDVPVPAPLPGEVLVKVSTAGVNPLDNMIVRGEVNAALEKVARGGSKGKTILRIQ